MHNDLKDIAQLHYVIVVCLFKIAFSDLMKFNRKLLWKTKKEE